MPLKINLPQFKAQYKKDLKKQIDSGNNLVKKIIVETFADIQQSPPVDTGRYRASHILQKDRASGGTRNPDKTRAKYTQDAQERQEQVNKTRFDFRKDRKWIISNNLAYAERIELGWSKKAPAGVYNPAKAKATARINKAINLFNSGKF